MRLIGHGNQYHYTTHSYLISLFLDCPPNMGLQCPDISSVYMMQRAIADGTITWHAHPHNAQYEFYDSSLLEYSFDLTHDLDRQFKLPPKQTAILVSCRIARFECLSNAVPCTSPQLNCLEHPRQQERLDALCCLIWYCCCNHQQQTSNSILPFEICTTCSNPHLYMFRTTSSHYLYIGSAMFLG